MRLRKGFAAMLTFFLFFSSASASAATMLRITGSFEVDSGSSSERLSFEYRLFYKLQNVITVDDYYPGCAVDCRSQNVEVYRASGIFGNNRVPFHAISGSISSTFDDASFISIEPNDKLYPTISGSFQTSTPDLRVRNGSNIYGDGWLTINYPDGRTIPVDAFRRSVSVRITEVLEPVPEPATWLMLLSGLGVIGTVARRRRNISLA